MEFQLVSELVIFLLLIPQGCYSTLSNPLLVVANDKVSVFIVCWRIE